MLKNRMTSDEFLKLRPKDKGPSIPKMMLCDGQRNISGQGDDATYLRENTEGHGHPEREDIDVALVCPIFKLNRLYTSKLERCGSHYPRSELGGR